MRLLVFSGILYLVGIAVILYFKPALMFRSDGTWKEFGIGRDPTDYTWLPFWLAAILWAVISYMTVLLVSESFSSGKHVPAELDDAYPRKGSTRKGKGAAALNSKRASNIANMPDRDVLPGYYILNTEKSRKGFPKYIYVGEAPPLELESELSGGGRGDIGTDSSSGDSD